jgi:alginate O-acetyltransferase complex protein AlgI
VSNGSVNIFVSKFFFVFLPLVLLIYHGLMRGRTAKFRFLLVASWLFYAWWSAAYLWVIVLTTVVDYYAGRLIEAAPDDRSKRRWLLMSITANLGLLGVFKYTGFLAGNAAGLARLFGCPVPEFVITIGLPLGISFHTFQGVSYTVDVYRGAIRAVRRFDDFALFVAFFPQLVAGPIVRAVEFLPQMAEPPRVTAAHVSEGLHWFVLGLCKKVFLADHLDAYVSMVYEHPAMFDAATHRWATVAWAAQIYADFSGYSDMAVGCAKWFGFDLPRNFNYPYLAASMSEFWRRWHMTLSTWIRDYLYFPLGGSRRGELRTHVNLMITFVLIGLLHGATWAWLTYGVIYGGLICLHRIWDRTLTGRPWADAARRHPLYRPAAIAATFYQVLLGLVLVRMKTWEGGVLIERSLLGFAHSGGSFLLPGYVPVLVGLVAAGHLFSGWRDKVCGLLEMPPALRAAAYVGGIVTVVCFGAGVSKTFIYIQF